MRRLLLAVLLLALCAGRAPAETREDLYWRLHRERNAVTRYGAPPTGTNSIPAGYRLLEYVESTGEQWVDIGSDVPMSGSVSFDATLTSVPSGAGLWGQQVYGTRILVYFRSMTVGLFEAGTYGTINFSTLPSVSVHDQQYGGSASAIVPRHLFTTTNSDGARKPYSRVRLRSFSLKNADAVCVRDFIPVADTNSVAGLWDRVSGTMFYSATATPLVAGPELRPATVLPAVSRETVREMLAPAPTGEPPELAGGDLWLDCLAIPEGNWLCECPIAGTTNTAWRAALCPSNILRAVVWRHAVGLAPTNLPVTLEHDLSRVIGRIERLYYEAGTGVVARISVTQAGYAWAVANHCAKPSPDVRCFTTGTNVAIRTDGWIHEHQDYLDARVAPRGDTDLSSVTNVPAGVQAIVMAPVYLRGLSLVGTPLLPTYIEQPVPAHLRDVYPLRPPRQWTWRNGE